MLQEHVRNTKNAFSNWSGSLKTILWPLGVFLLATWYKVCICMFKFEASLFKAECFCWIHSDAAELKGQSSTKTNQRSLQTKPGVSLPNVMSSIKSASWSSTRWACFSLSFLPLVLSLHYQASNNCRKGLTEKSGEGEHSEVGDFHFKNFSCIFAKSKLKLCTFLTLSLWGWGDTKPCYCNTG